MKQWKRRDFLRGVKKTAAILMTTALFVTSMNFSGWEVQAAKKTAVKKLKVTVENKTLYVGKYSPYTKTKLKVTVSPKKANQKVTFKSKTPKIAKVNKKGVVTAKKAGKAKISITTKGKNAKGKKITKTVKITVKKYKAPTGLKASISTTKLKIGGTAKITASLLGKPTCKTLLYSSSKPGIATVSSAGVVTAKASGEAVITVKSEVKSNKGKILTKSFNVKVQGNPAVTPNPTKPTSPTNPTEDTSKESESTNIEDSSGEQESSSNTEDTSKESQSSSENDSSNESSSNTEDTSKEQESSSNTEDTSKEQESSSNIEDTSKESQSSSENDSSNESSSNTEESSNQEESTSGTEDEEKETEKAEVTPVVIENLDYLEDAQKKVELPNPALNTNNTINVSGATAGMTIQSTMTINKLNSNANTYLWNYTGAGSWPVAYQFVTTDGKLYTNFDLRAEFVTNADFLPIGEEFTLTTSVTATEIRIYINGELKAYYNAVTGFTMGGSFNILNTSLVTANTTSYGDVNKSSWTQLVLGKSPACVDWDQPPVLDGTISSFDVFESALQPKPQEESEKLVFPENLAYEITPDNDEVELGAVLLNAKAGTTLTYTSMDNSIAGFSESGKLKMKKAGQVKVKAVSSNGAQAESIVTISYSTIGIHDPSVFQDPKTGYYYSVGSHCLIGYSKDMKSWAYVANSQTGYSDANKMFTKVYSEEFADVYKFVNPGTANPEGVWAPSIIYSEKTDKYYMYVTIASGGAQGKCAIVLTESDKPEGPYAYKEMLVASDITTSDADKTNLMDVLGVNDVSKIPTKYTADNRTYPDCIDATVFYDHDGRLWMVYGSFTCYGGIRMIQLDPATGGRLATAAYEDTGSATVIGDKDPYYGIKLANTNGEGPFIMEVSSEKSSTGYYYFLWTSVGGLQSYGGYHMRMYRSENVEGPYVDTAGNLATSDLGRANLGLRVMDNYKFTFMDYAFTSCGGNSAILPNAAGTAENGKLFLHYHQKWANGTEGFVTKSNQMFLNEEGWLVTAPFAYDGEEMNKTYTKEQVAGEYEFILHRTTYTKTGTTNYDYSDAVAVTLNEDGTITGYYTGTWSLTDNYITIKVGKDTYKGVVLEQTIEDAAKTKNMVFTAVGEGNIQSVWGMKMIEDAQYYAEFAKNKVKVPQEVNANFTLPTKSLEYGFDISWTSSNTDLISFNGGEAIVTLGDNADNVTLTATFTKGNYSKEFTWNVKVGAYEIVLPSTITSNSTLTLPQKSAQGSVITWTSSNTDVINPSTGSVTIVPSSIVEVTLTAKYGNITKEFQIRVGELSLNAIYTQNYETADLTIENAGWKKHDGLTGEIVSESNNSFAKFTSTGSGPRGGLQNFNIAAESLTSTYVVQTDFTVKTATYTGSGQPTTQIALVSQGNAITGTNSASIADSECIIDLQATGMSSNVFVINGNSDITVTIPAGTWCHMEATVNQEAKQVFLLITNAEGKEMYSGTFAISGNTQIKGIYTLNGRGGTVTQFDNTIVKVTG